VSGKTILIYGLIKILTDEGYKIGYFKPVSMAINKIGPNRWVDDDILSMKEALDLPDKYETLSPIVIRRRFLELYERTSELRDRIVEAYDTISRDKDIVFIESYRTPYSLYSIGLSGFELAKLLGCKALFIIKNGEDYQIDEVKYCKDIMDDMGIESIGAILNQVPYHIMERVKEFIKDFMEEMGLEVLGLVPERDEFIAPTLLDISTALDADVLEGEDYLDNIAGEFLVGAMGVDAALKWLRRSRRPLIITGGDRTELLLTILETGPSGIILTGNLYPALKVLARAREKGVPILLVPYDTYTTVERLREIHGRITSHSLKKKEDMIKSIIMESIDIDRLVERILG
jgi:hypothetical protein